MTNSLVLIKPSETPTVISRGVEPVQIWWEMDVGSLHLSKGHLLRLLTTQELTIKRQNSELAVGLYAVVHDLRR
jgi:hypothetical protein